MDEEKKQLAMNLAAEARQRVELLNKALTQVGTIAEAAVVWAWETGEICIEAKKLVGHGNYYTWLATARLTPSTASRYSKLRHKYQTLEHIKSVNGKREGYLALIVPNKEQPDHDGDVKFTPSLTHLCLLNDWKKLLHRVEIGKQKIDIEQARKDLKPIYTWMKEEIYRE